MNRARAKLHSSSGASMVMALLFLLLCLMVGAVILTAASANAGRVSRQRSQQQDYFTVSSAAKLLRDELEGLTFTTGEWHSSDSGDGSSETGSVTPHVTPVGSLRQLVGERAQMVFENQTVYLTPESNVLASIPLSVADTGGDFDAVSATLFVDVDFTLTIAISLTDSPASYPLTLAFPPDADVAIASNTVPYTVTVQEYVEGVLTDVTYYYDVTTDTRTVTVSWDVGIISKGG